ncbi:hypothetical protein EYB31_39020 [Paenibacillus thalictri]|uniref:Uncharacterized protein n=1 Tax=Paenibacillus thalictri TaxID=2527873 RepID=A0A4Q9DDC6_9BACL|nr:hypothetical protein EYB31_39020 [Paenibacillus thalictri]
MASAIITIVSSIRNSTCIIEPSGLSKRRSTFASNAPRLREFYDKKRGEGKPSRVSMVACINKLLHWLMLS